MLTAEEKQNRAIELAHMLTTQIGDSHEMAQEVVNYLNKKYKIMLKTEYDSLAKRFLSDLNLPFQFVDFNHFMYCINTFGYKKKWENLLALIDERYDGNPNKFLDDYYQIRDNIINSTLNNNGYQYFNTLMEMDYFSLDAESRCIPSTSIYNRENNKKYFLSIDLKHSNFQTLKHILSGIVNNANTYEEFIGGFTDLDYIKNSKYTRQVIFGKLNPKRQITATKYFTNEIRKLVEPIINPYGYKIVSMRTDEIVFEVPANEIHTELTDELHDMILETTKFDVHVEFFKLFAFEFKDMESGTCKFTFYQKDFGDGDISFKGIPNTYYKMVQKLYFNEPLCDEDYLFEYEGTPAQLLDEFQIKLID